MAQASAANGRQQLVRRLGGQHKAHLPRWLFQRFEQGVGGDRVHLLCRVDQHHLAAPARAGALGKFDGIAHGVDADLAAGLALFVIDIGLGLFAQRPGQLQQGGFRHQHTQISMGAHRNRVAAAADTACTYRRGRFTQPGLGQLQGQAVLAQTRWAVQQPGVALLGQQLADLGGNPGRCCAGGFRLRHGNNPLLRTAANTSAQTCSCVWSALMRAKRALSAAQRWP